jgi:altronate hydrolase
LFMRSPDAAILLSEADNVIVLPKGAAAGSSAGAVTLAEDSPPGHKAARNAIARGGVVVKYGHAIGEATRDIRPGEWVHEHNVKTRLGNDLDLPAWEPKDYYFREREPETPAGEKRYFMGYRRRSGRPGVRNDLWVIPTVGCVNGEIRSEIRAFRKPDGIDSVKVLEHPYGCSQLGRDMDMTRDILAGLAHNPNAAGVLLVGLGCENLTLASLEEAVRARGSGVVFRNCELQTSPDGALVAALGELAGHAAGERVKCPAEELLVGVKCGGSDGLSGLSANPLAGRFADWLVAQGGGVLATEIPEMFGAEEVILSRIRDRAVYEAFIAADRWFRDYYGRHGQPIYENPSPGNRAGGITTLEEKSLGAVEKTGSGIVTSVLGYGEAAGAGSGVQIAFAPGNDLVSCTSLAGSGAQMILFTTGRGTPFGSIVPTLKISTNSPLFESRRSWIDFDAGTVLTGETWQDATARLTDAVLRTASGERTAHERKETGEIAIFKDGVIL